MQDGYYLSIYTHVNPLAHLYRISLRHDQGMALWKKDKKKVELVRYWEFERRSGLKKHDLSFYNIEQGRKAVNAMLSELGLSLNNIEMVWGTPGFEKEQDEKNYAKDFPCPLHSLSHLFSGMMVESDLFYNGKILALALDGGPDNVVDINAREKKFYWGAVVNFGKIEYFSVPSPGVFWSFLRLEYHLEEGSLMAIGSATTAYFEDEATFLNKIPSVYEGKDFDKAYEWVASVVKTAEYLDKKSILDYDDRFSLLENRISMVVKIVQKGSFIMLDNVVKKAIEDYKINPSDTVLSMTGGFALNCPTNSYIMEKYKFKKFSTCPSVSDSGIALGLGLYEFYKRCSPFEFKLKNAYYGHTEDRFVNEVIDGWKHYIKSVQKFNENQFCDDLVHSPIIWFQGGAEIGPRALGARSILGDPRQEKTKEALNKIKQRQWWRPVAPIVLEEEQSRWFETTFISPYMLCTSEVKADKKDKVTASLHLDSSARIQSISELDNPILYQAIKKFFEITEVPIICNTSLNDKGEPIIDNFEQCINFALRKKIKVIYINETRIELQNAESYKEENPLGRDIHLFDTLSDEEKERAKLEWNPYDFDFNELDLYLNMPELKEYDICKERDARLLRRILTQWKRLNQTVWKALLT